jgi:hypothetical protein
MTGLIVILVAIGQAAAGDRSVRYAELEGAYVSSVNGGCTLELKRDASYSLRCGARVQMGHAIRFGEGIVVGGSDVAGDIELPPPSPPQGGPSWPPSFRDPTRGPYVVAGPERGTSFWLQPLRWGKRLYLIRDGDYQGFCQAVRSGAEPRKATLGDEFLRRGDHLKAVGQQLPKECGPK